MRELAEIPEEEEIPAFEVINDNTIKHFSHDHNLQINKDGHSQILLENIVCEACVLHILSEPFYSCNECNFILHEKCANHPRQKRHVFDNKPFTLDTHSRNKVNKCSLCKQCFTGFRYENSNAIIDVRCAAISDTFEHESHQHPLYYNFTSNPKSRSRCRKPEHSFFQCDDQCEYIFYGKCALLPKKVMKNRYDDHPLSLAFGDVNGEYWCEICEKRLNPKEWFYACNDCNTTVHMSCVVGDFSYIMAGTVDNFVDIMSKSVRTWKKEVVANTSICRPLCFVCNFRCKLPNVLKLSKAGVVVYFCSWKCYYNSEL